MKSCSNCKEVKPFDLFHKNKTNKDGYQYQCKECGKTLYSEKARKRAELYRKHNKEKVSEAKKKCYERKKEEYLNSTKRWKQENKDRVLSSCSKRRASKIKRTPSWANEQKIKEKYTLAKYFEFITLGIKYHVDHIVPLQGDTVCGLHVESNLQIIRADQNLTKNNRWCWDTQS